jgi:hypothetical protein
MRIGLPPVTFTASFGVSSLSDAAGLDEPDDDDLMVDRDDDDQGDDEEGEV